MSSSSHESYTPRPDITAELQKKSIAMLVGPSAIGKSSLINEVAAREEDIARVRTITTRAPRLDDDPKVYDYLTHADIERLIATRNVVQYMRHPTTGEIYGSLVDGYPAEINLLDTLSGGVAPMRQLPFKQALTIGIISPVDEWRKRFTDRYPTPSEEAEKRIDEAHQSVQWLIDEAPDNLWVINRQGRLAESAFALTTLLRNPDDSKTSVPEEAYDFVDVTDSYIKTYKDEASSTFTK